MLAKSLCEQTWLTFGDFIAELGSECSYCIAGDFCDNSQISLKSKMLEMGMADCSLNDAHEIKMHKRSMFLLQKGEMVPLLKLRNSHFICCPNTDN